MAARAGAFRPIGRRAANVKPKGPAEPGTGGKHRFGGQPYAGRHVAKSAGRSAFGVEHGEVAKAFRLPGAKPRMINPSKRANRKAMDASYRNKQADLREQDIRSGRGFEQPR